MLNQKPEIYADYRCFMRIYSCSRFHFPHVPRADFPQVFSFSHSVFNIYDMLLFRSLRVAYRKQIAFDA